MPQVTAYHTCGYDGSNGSEWWSYDWSKLTTVAEFCGRQDATFYGLVCAAHSHGVQVINWMDTTADINQCPGAGFTVNGTHSHWPFVIFKDRGKMSLAFLRDSV